MSARTVLREIYLCAGRYRSHRWEGYSNCMRSGCNALNPKFYPGIEPTIDDAGVIAAIRKSHLKANIDGFEKDGFEMQWEKAYVDPGGTIFGPGPYVKLPCRKLYDRSDKEWFSRMGIEIKEAEWDERVIRVYPPKRLRARLREHWARAS